jgi:hypothetical protein
VFGVYLNLELEAVGGRMTEWNEGGERTGKEKSEKKNLVTPSANIFGDK